MNAWQNTILVICLGLKHLVMAVAHICQAAVSIPAIGSNGASRGHVRLYKRDQLVSATLLDHLQPQPAQFPPLAFNGRGYRTLRGCTPSALPASRTAKIKFVGFNDSTEFFSAHADRTTPKFLQPSPGRIVVL